MSEHEVANIAGVVLGSLLIIGCVYLTIFATRVAREHAERASRLFGASIARRYTAANYRVASIPGIGLGVFMVVFGVMGKYS